jgi:hypothetical protein
MMINRQPMKTVTYTGEGFKGEKFLSAAALLLTVFSTILLIDLTVKQRNHLKLQLEEANARKNNTSK